MAYRLSIADDVPGSVRRCAHEQLAGAIRELERAGDDPVAAIHQARKHLKKARALLRLVRPALGKDAYRRENDALREAARALSSTRDADVLAQTAATLAGHGVGRVPAEAIEELRAALEAEAAAGREHGGDASALTPVLEALRAADLRVERWPLDGADRDTVLAGAVRAYARGREAFAVARAEPTPELLHAWRKRAKDLWYHQRLLGPAWPPVLKAYAQEAHRLTELLGDDHDLAGLAERLAAPAPPLPLLVAARSDALLALAEHRREQLRTEATQLGRRVYAESPKAFSRRLGRWLDVARAEQREA
ncbi:MAG TPA: CHAD domain-containing protein [Conexibacter sp.]|nr:CHAD domain-containing protein [Conexibacter sp.]